MARSRWALLLLAAVLLAGAASCDAWGSKKPDVAADTAGAGGAGVSALKAAAIKAASGAKAAAAEPELQATLPSSLDAAHNTYWYNEVTGATSDSDPTLEFHGHQAADDEHRYWVDPVSGASTWERPAAYAWAATPSTEHPGTEYYYNSVTQEATWDKPAILGWKAAERGFWFNNVTGAAQWDSPEALGLPSTEPAHEGRRYWVVDGSPTWDAPEAYAWRAVAADGNTFFENTATGEVTWTRPEALGWSRRSVTKQFWYNSVTGKSQREPPVEVVGHAHQSGQRYFQAADGSATWERPVAAAWNEVPSPEHEGRTYFHNNITGEVVWERPADSNVAWQVYHEEL